MTHQAAVVFAALFCVAMAAWGQSQQTNRVQPTNRNGDRGGAEAAPLEKTGIAVGHQAPPIKLKDQTGKERSLEEMLHDGTVALVFYRSASW